MPMHRKNTSKGEMRQPAPGKFQGQMETRAFALARARVVMRQKMAKASRKKNRRKK